jgi:soluble lytic murein transglycosylase-like protein
VIPRFVRRIRPQAAQAAVRRVPVAALALLLAPVPAPGTAEEFTFRRVGVAEMQAGRRITVQIDPEEQARRIAAPASLATAAARTSAPGGLPAGPAGPSPGAHSWFWERVSPARDAPPGRWLMALAALDGPAPGGAVPEPGLSALARIARAHNADLLGATVGTRVSPALALAVIAVESAGRPRAVSSAGAQGLMQLIPATAERFGVRDPFDPAQNIRGGVSYLDWLIDHFEGDAVLALAGYNAGEGAVRRAGGVPPYAETRDYVPRVLAAWRVARGLCRTPPELPADGCVFVLPQVEAAATPVSGG